MNHGGNGHALFKFRIAITRGGFSWGAGVISMGGKVHTA